MEPDVFYSLMMNVIKVVSIIVLILIIIFLAKSDSDK